MSGRRVRALTRKELREYRRNRQIVVSMAALPLVFCVYPLVQVVTLSSQAAPALEGKAPLLFLLGIPALVPGTLAAYAVAGERQQGTLEPVLTTPVRREELLLAKAIAALLPALVVSYAVTGAFCVAVLLLAEPAVASDLVRAPVLVGLALLAPLVAGLSIWVGVVFSTRSRDPRVAAQLSALASFPSIIAAAAVAAGAVPATAGLGLAAGVLLLALCVLGWRVASAAFDREKLITG